MSPFQNGQPCLCLPDLPRQEACAISRPSSVVRSPYAGDRVKEECYAIDFSPRRTLAVVDQYVLNNVSSSSEDDRYAKLAEFLRFCPITEISASKQSHYDTELFIRNVTSVYSESLIRNGFRDDCLYGNLDNLRKQDLRVLDQIAEAIVRGIATERQRNREMVENAKNGGKRKTRKSAAEKKAPADNHDAKLNAAQNSHAASLRASEPA